MASGFLSNNLPRLSLSLWSCQGDVSQCSTKSSGSSTSNLGCNTDLTAGKLDMKYQSASNVLHIAVENDIEYFSASSTKNSMGNLPASKSLSIKKTLLTTKLTNSLLAPISFGKNNKGRQNRQNKTNVDNSDGDEALAVDMAAISGQVALRGVVINSIVPSSSANAVEKVSMTGEKESLDYRKELLSNVESGTGERADKFLMKNATSMPVAVTKKEKILQKKLVERGNKWFGLHSKEINPTLLRELEILNLRSNLDGKNFMKVDKNRLYIKNKNLYTGKYEGNSENFGKAFAAVHFCRVVGSGNNVAAGLGVESNGTGNSGSRKSQKSFLNFILNDKKIQDWTKSKMKKINAEKSKKHVARYSKKSKYCKKKY